MSNRNSDLKIQVSYTAVARIKKNVYTFFIHHNAYASIHVGTCIKMYGGKSVYFIFNIFASLRVVGFIKIKCNTVQIFNNVMVSINIKEYAFIRKKNYTYT